MRAIKLCGPLVALVALLASGCAVSPPEDGPALPTFPAPAGTSAPAAPGAVDKGVVPDDCSRLLTVADLGALLGLPLDSVVVRTTLGVASPSVGRTERLDCAYTATAGGARTGRPLLGVNAAAYADGVSAADHWRINVGAQRGQRRDLSIGAASAVLFESGGETVLTVLYGAGTLTFTLPSGPLPGNRNAGDVLVDMALRVLPTIAGAAPKPGPAPVVTRTPGPAQAAGAP